MAFMALFGWIFIPIILVGLVWRAAAGTLLWMKAHALLIGLLAAGLLLFNLLLLVWLLRLRAGQRREGRRRSVWTLLAALWEGWVVLLCALFLIVQPLRFIPEDLGQPHAPGSACLGEWEITARRGSASRSQEETDRFLGVRLVYEEDRFTSNGQSWALDPVRPYETSSVWREERIIIPGTQVNRSFEALDIQGRKVSLVLANVQGDTGGPLLGQRVYVLDGNTLLTCYEGVFYQAERVESSS